MTNTTTKQDRIINNAKLFANRKNPAAERIGELIRVIEDLDRRLKAANERIQELESER